MDVGPRSGVVVSGCACLPPTGSCALSSVRRCCLVDQGMVAFESLCRCDSRNSSARGAGGRCAGMGPVRGDRLGIFASEPGSPPGLETSGRGARRDARTGAQCPRRLLMAWALTPAAWSRPTCSPTPGSVNGPPHAALLHREGRGAQPTRPSCRSTFDACLRLRDRGPARRCARRQRLRSVGDARRGRLSCSASQATSPPATPNGLRSEQRGREIGHLPGESRQCSPSGSCR